MLIYKKGDANTLNNYRPVSVLSVVSKIFKIALKARIVNFLEKQDVFHPVPHEYRKQGSTTTVLTQALQCTLMCLTIKST